MLKLYMLETIIERINYLEGLSEQFDFIFYLTLYKDDLLKSGINNKSKARQHYLDFGIKEGRIKSTRDFYHLYPYFDWKYYVSIYPDVESDEMKAIVHFYNIGRFQMRTFEDPNVSKTKSTKLDLLGKIQDQEKIIENLQSKIDMLKQQLNSQAE